MVIFNATGMAAPPGADAGARMTFDAPDSVPLHSDGPAAPPLTTEQVLEMLTRVFGPVELVAVRPRVPTDQQEFPATEGFGRRR